MHTQLMHHFSSQRKLFGQWNCTWHLEIVWFLVRQVCCRPDSIFLLAIIFSGQDNLIAETLFFFLKKNDPTLFICIFNSYFSTSRFIKLQVSLTRVCHGDLHSVSPHHSSLCSVHMVKISGYVKMIGAHLST